MSPYPVRLPRAPRSTSVDVGADLLAEVRRIEREKVLLDVRREVAPIAHRAEVSRYSSSATSAIDLAVSILAIIDRDLTEGDPR